MQSTMRNATDFSVDPDHELVLACQEALRTGRKGPFEKLYERHYARVYRQCLGALGNESDARDAAQDTFHRVLRRLLSYQQRARFTSWLHRVTFNCCRELRRSRHQRLQRQDLALAEPGAKSEPAATPEDAPEVGLWQRDLEQLVEDALVRLSPGLRAVVEARYFMPCSYQQVAARLGVSVGTVKSRLFRAHALLKDELERRLEREELPTEQRPSARGVVHASQLHRQRRPA
jgi:RNA polymerase sigma-70 factor (ECF subfamily)